MSKTTIKKGFPRWLPNDKWAVSSDAPKTKVKTEVPKKASEAVLNTPTKSRRSQARSPPLEEQESPPAPRRNTGHSL